MDRLLRPSVRMPVLLLTVLAASLCPQPGGQGVPPDPASMVKMRVSQIATELKLTPAQKTTATAIFMKASTDSAEVQDSVRAAREALQVAARANDVANMEKLAATIGSLTARSTLIESKADAEFYQSLSPEQRKKYDAMPRFGPGGRGGSNGPGVPGGPGGPGGPPGGRGGGGGE